MKNIYLEKKELKNFKMKINSAFKEIKVYESTVIFFLLCWFFSIKHGFFFIGFFFHDISCA
jgi:hypothetical protein